MTHKKWVFIRLIVTNTPMRLRLMILFALVLTMPAIAQRQMEKLSRGLVAIAREDGKVYLSWRLLGSDPAEIAFTVYRDNIKLSDKPISTSTNFLDADPPAKAAKYSVRPITDGREGEASDALYLARPYLEIPLKTPQGYAPNDASVGDL